MSLPPEPEVRTFPPSRGTPAVWAEWVGRRYRLFHALAAGNQGGASPDDLARATGYDTTALEVWLRVAYAHGLLTYDSHRGYALAPSLAGAFPPSSPQADSEDWAGFPPPYRLDCDMACFWRLVPAEVAARWAGTPVRSWLGRTLLLIMAARYTQAAAGPERRPIVPPAGAPLLYQEIACALPVEGHGGGAYVFPALWVDSHDSLPRDLGWHYGFPKQSAVVDVASSGRRVVAQAWDSQGELLRGTAWKVARAPGRAVAAVAAMRAVFLASGLQAVLRLERVDGAALLLPGPLHLPRLEALGLTGPDLGGLWLHGVRLYLSEPEEG